MISGKGLVLRENQSKNNSVGKNAVPQNTVKLHAPSHGLLQELIMKINVK